MGRRNFPAPDANLESVLDFWAKCQPSALMRDCAFKVRQRASVEGHAWKSAEAAGNCRKLQEPAG
eukprot:10217172-Alexandrium_andersonii.AAC.1